MDQEEAASVAEAVDRAVASAAVIVPVVLEAALVTVDPAPEVSTDHIITIIISSPFSASVDPTLVTDMAEVALVD